MIRIYAYLLIASLFFACNSSTQADAKTDKDQSETGEQIQDDSKPLPYTEKYETGQLKVVGQKLKGEKVGKWVSYYPDGKIWSEGEYFKGEKNGKFKDYYGTGILRYKGAYVNDLKQGPWYFYDEDGKVDKKVIYKKGEIEEEK